MPTLLFINAPEFDLLDILSTTLETRSRSLILSISIFETNSVSKLKKLLSTLIIFENSSTKEL